MNHREYLTKMNEAPIAYDDGTSFLIGKIDKKSKTKWTEAPDIHADIDEVTEWILEAQKKGFISKEIIGQGAVRMCKMNDGKTVFKFNFSQSENTFGNQTAFENKFFKKWGTKFGDIITHIYKSGDNWQITEFVKKFEIGKFEDLTNVAWKDFRRITKLCDSKDLKSDYRKAGTVEGVFKIMKTRNPNHENILDLFLKSKDITRIFQCSCETGLSVRDLHEGNFGFRGNHLVIIDYGFDDNINRRT